MSSEKAAHFAVELLKQNVGKQESFVVSPFSLGSALAIVHKGTGGESRNELTKLLITGDAHDEVTNHYSGLTKSLEVANGTDVTVEVASKFFVRNEVALNDEYKTVVAKLFDASAERYDFGDAVGAAKVVNGFCDEKTHGKIKEVVKPDVFQEAAALLVNAVYFKGLWSEPFKAERTMEDDFHGVNGDRKEQFMVEREKDVLLNFTNEDVQVMGIAYKNEEFTMWFFLPKEGLSLTNWIASLDANTLVDLIKNANKDKCNVRLPRFKIESSIPATEQLQALGVRSIFSDRADLSGISDVPLQVSDVVHKAVIEVNEEGAEAAAVTAITIQLCCYVEYPDFNANRPFGYAIAHNTDLLFVGAYY